MHKTINILDDIHECLGSYTESISAIRNGLDSTNDIDIFIDSEGGFITTAFSMAMQINQLRNLVETNVKIYVLGRVSSAAFIFICLAEFDEIYFEKSSYGLVHAGSKWKPRSVPGTEFLDKNMVPFLADMYNAIKRYTDVSFDAFLRGCDIYLAPEQMQDLFNHLTEGPIMACYFLKSIVYGDKK